MGSETTNERRRWRLPLLTSWSANHVGTNNDDQSLMGTICYSTKSLIWGRRRREGRHDIKTSVYIGAAICMLMIMASQCSSVFCTNEFSSQELWCQHTRGARKSEYFHLKGIIPNFLSRQNANKNPVPLTMKIRAASFFPLAIIYRKNSSLKNRSFVVIVLQIINGCQWNWHINLTLVNQVSQKTHMKISLLNFTSRSFHSWVVPHRAFKNPEKILWNSYNKVESVANQSELPLENRTKGSSGRQ